MRIGSWIAIALGAAIIVGLGFVVVPLAAGARQQPPPVSPEELVGSVLTAEQGAFAGTVQLDNRLGLPALPGVPQSADGTSTARVAHDGANRSRLALPTAQGERLVVNDGTTVWFWDSAERTVSKVPASEVRERREPAADPAEAARRMVESVRGFSTITVDGTSSVAGRSAYQLVLTPLPTERTLLREVRVAVDTERRLPLQLTVSAQGTDEPALQAGFTEITFAPQDDALFTFTPPPGATVREGGPGQNGRVPDELRGAAEPKTVGEGWDTVLLATVPAQARSEVGPMLNNLATPVSGPWGSGRLISTAVATAIITDDGRVATGAVPEQVLTEALAW